MKRKIMPAVIAVLMTAVLFTFPVTAAPLPQEEETAEPLPLPAAPVLKYPVNIETTERIGFYWDPAENAESYEVLWKNASGGQGTIEVKADDWTCRAGSCIAYEEVPGDGDYTWTVTASNGTGSAASEEAAFTVRSGIPAPKAYLPNSALSSQRPVAFQWDDVRSPKEYRVQVLDRSADTICMDRTFQTSQLYLINAVCYIETNIYFPEGEYSWRVQGIGESSVSGWSGWTDFTVNCTECYTGNYVNTTSAAIFPNGRTFDPQPTFSWLAVMGASYYTLTVTEPEGGTVLEETVQSSVCSDVICSFKPELTLEPGRAYAWSVSTYGINGARWGTGDGVVELTDAVPAPEVEFVGPEEGGKISEDNPQIVWSDPGPSAASFRLYISDEAGEVLFYGDLNREEAWCDGLTCSIVFMEIPEGSYRILITPVSETNTPGKTVSLSFGR